jgi:acyl-CoA hydrolase
MQRLATEDIEKGGEKPIEKISGFGQMKRSEGNTKSKPKREELAGRPVSASRTEMTELVLPQDSNLLGNILGGRVMHLIDIAGAIAAHRHCHRQVVTASVDHLDFLNPVRVGDLIILEAQVNRAFHTSVEVGVEVYSEDSAAGVRKHTTTAFLTFVALDEAGKPVPVPPLLVQADEEKRRFEEAGARRVARIGAKKP